MSYQLKVAIDSAWFELNKMEEPTVLAVLLLSKKYSPKTFSDVGDLLKDEDAVRMLTPMKAQPGRLVIDVISATIAEYLYEQLFYNLQQKAQEKVEQVKMQAMRDGVKTKKG